MNATARTKFATVDEYVAASSEDARAHLTALRQVIAKAAPQARELVSYNIPAFHFHGILVWYGAFKNHIGFYPTSSAMKAFAKDLAGYAGAKGSVRFPLDRPLPLDVVTKIVKFRIGENLEKARSKKK